MPEDVWNTITPEQQIEFIISFVKDEWVTKYFACAARHEGLVDWYLGGDDGSIAGDE